MPLPHREYGAAAYARPLPQDAASYPTQHAGPCVRSALRPVYPRVRGWIAWVEGLEWRGLGWLGGVGEREIQQIGSDSRLIQCIGYKKTKQSCAPPLTGCPILPYSLARQLTLNLPTENLPMTTQERAAAVREALGIVAELDLSAESPITDDGDAWIERIETQLDRMLWEAWGAA